MCAMLAGAARVNITPPVGVALDGYMDRADVAQSIHDELHARALVLDVAGDRIALVSCDLVGVDAQLTAAVRRTASEATGIEPENIIVTATHTHSGPALSRDRAKLFGTPHDRALADVTERKIASAIIIASQQVRPATGSLCFGEVNDLGRNRRKQNGPYDPSLGIAAFVSEARGEAIAFLSNYACHATVMGAENLSISADYPGYAMEQLEWAHQPAVSLFLNGAAGDVSTRFTRDESTFREVARFGDMLVSEAERALKGPRIDLDARGIVIRREPVTLPLRKPPSLREIQELIKFTKQMSVARALRRRKLVTEMEAIGIGNLVILTVPGEAFSQLGMEMRRAGGDRHVFVAGYANDHVGYIPTREVLSEGGYETTISLLAPEAIDIVRDTAARLIRSV